MKRTRPCLSLSHKERWSILDLADEAFWILLRAARRADSEDPVWPDAFRSFRRSWHNYKVFRKPFE